MPESKTGQTFWQQLKNRKVIRVGTVYLIAGWFIIQVADTSFSNFGIPDWGFRLVALLIILGLPVALILAWALEVTPEGIKPTSAGETGGAGDDSPGASTKSRNWIPFASVTVLTTLVFGLLAIQFYGPSDKSSTAPERALGLEEIAKAPGDSQSIAVLPLVNMSSLEENEYFAGGIHEDVLTNLSRIEDLQVISRTSMLRYATSDLTLLEIGEELGVDYIVEGSVRRIGDHVRVTVQLINAHNDVHLWANNYERQLVDVFATQSEISREISDSIHLELKPESVGRLEGMPTISVKAYDLYIKAQGLEKTEGETEENMILRRGMLEEAVVEDPDFVEAWAVLKRVYDLQLDRLRRRDWYLEHGQDKEQLAADIRARSQRAMDKALALDPNNVETRLSQAVDHIRVRTDERRQEQKDILDGIIAEDPENAKAWYHLAFWHNHLIDLPNPDKEAIDEKTAAAFEKALQLDPFNARMVASVLSWYRDLGDMDAVGRLANRLEQIVPETAAERRLARASWRYERIQWQGRFQETGDVSMVEEYSMMLQAALDSNEFSNSTSIIKVWNKSQERMYAGDLDSVIELSQVPWDFNESYYHPIFFSLLKFAAIEIYHDRGDMDEARDEARLVLQYEDALLALDQDECRCFMGVLARAHEELGNAEEARYFSNKLLERQEYGLIETLAYSLAYFETEQAVEQAFLQLAKTPDWNGFDDIAISYMFHFDFLAHPRVKAYYVEQGKWIDYLSTRVAEYSEYKHGE